jgi:hypothetical protein
MQAYLVLVEGKEALLGATPTVCMELGLSQPGKDLLGLQFSCHRAIIGLADEVPDDAVFPWLRFLFTMSLAL